MTAAMSDYDEPRAHALREEYHAVFGGEELPVPVESIAEDLLGLAVEARELEVSGMLLPAERRILVNAAEPEPRRRFTIAHELGHWICQCVGREDAAPVYCRAEEIGVDPEAKGLEGEANIFAANLVMPEEAVRAAGAKNTFGVSDQALGWRRYNLGLVANPPTE